MKSWLVWLMFGALPFYWVAWTFSTFLYLQFIPWLVIGIHMNRRFLDRLQMHHMVTAQDFAALKVKGVLLWAVVYIELLLTFGSLSIF